MLHVAIELTRDAVVGGSFEHHEAVTIVCLDPQTPEEIHDGIAALPRPDSSALLRCQGWERKDWHLACAATLSLSASLFLAPYPLTFLALLFPSGCSDGRKIFVTC